MNKLSMFKDQQGGESCLSGVSRDLGRTVEDKVRAPSFYLRPVLTCAVGALSSILSVMGIQNRALSRGIMLFISYKGIF